MTGTIPALEIVFLDANVLFSAAYSVLSRLRLLWSIDGVRLVTSDYVVEEARRNLRTDQQLRDLESILPSVQVITDVGSVDRSILSGLSLPAKDEPILLAAVGAGATHLLTGDVRRFGRLYGQIIAGVEILPPAAYLDRFGDRPPREGAET